ncbi:carboxymuconolactone decarboxylase family protein [uncultured Enterovirga sp.]|uniref:carboxymuconolactone decarboxylase family protein n=1 Tax=uncultured Enterovirga sp. TaxID=2026352 RepID=UPI0035C99690
MSDLQPRIGRETFRRLAPDVVAALAALGETATKAGLDPALLELVKLRASQINGCAFCLQYHLTAARTLRVPREKLDLLVAWQEVDLFSERERAALTWTEALTEVTLGISDDDYEDVREHFSEVQLAHLTGAIALINSWNRISIAFRFAPEPPGPRAVPS